MGSLTEVEVVPQHHTPDSAHYGIGRVGGSISSVRGPQVPWQRGREGLGWILDPCKKYIYIFAWVEENKGDPKKLKRQKGELILGRVVFQSPPGR